MATGAGHPSGRDKKVRAVAVEFSGKKLHEFRKKMTKNLKVAAKGRDMSELGLTAINVQVDKVRYSVGFWSRCPFP